MERRGLVLCIAQLASRQDVGGIKPSIAPSCRRTGSRSPSMARRSIERASSSGLIDELPIALSVNHASSNAVSSTTSVCGSKRAVVEPVQAPPSPRYRVCRCPT